MNRIKRLFLTLAVGLFAVQAALADASGTWTSLTDLDASAYQNVVRAATDLNGCYLPTGALFSLNAATGYRDESAGYVDAIGAWGDVVPGGGVELVATALYQAVRQYSHIEFLDLCFSPSGLVLVDDRENQDFSFFNYGKDLIIQMTLESDGLTCTVLSPERAARKRSSEDNTAGLASIVMPQDEAWRANARLACSSINDISLLPGVAFSFNAIVGPRLEAYGYLPAQGGSESTEIGFGADAVASALYMALDGLEGVEILETNAYSGWAESEYDIPWQYSLKTDYEEDLDFAFLWNGTGVLSLYARLDGDRLLIEVKIT